MIPTIEQIVERLLAGEITKQQALGWLNQHAEDAGYCLRDEFAGRAMQAAMDGSSPQFVAIEAYKFADAMLLARKP